VELIDPCRRLHLLRPGNLVVIQGTVIGCLGAEGKIGVITDEPNQSGLLSHKPGVNVKLDAGFVWLVNKDAVKPFGK
jgi:hypothetical protein